MKQRRFDIVVLALLLLACGAAAQQVMDRVVATVNGQPILQSDWDLEMRYEAFMDNRHAGTDDARRAAALERVIDQQLLREQMKGNEPQVSDAEVADKIAQVRKQTPGAETDNGWRRALANAGLEEDDFRERVAAQLELLRFIDQRLRPSVHIEAKAIETYYRDNFLPELRQRGGSEVPLAEVSSRIEEILTQQQMDQVLSSWLKDLRRSGAIRVLVAEGKAPESSQ